MASSSKSINMPVVFTISVCGIIGVCASTVFAMAWYSHEQKKLLEKRVDAAPFHDEAYMRAYDEQKAENEEGGIREDKINGETVEVELMPIDEAMDTIVARNSALNGSDDDHRDDQDDLDGHAGHGH